MNAGLPSIIGSSALRIPRARSDADADSALAASNEEIIPLAVSSMSNTAMPMRVHPAVCSFLFMIFQSIVILKGEQFAVARSLSISIRSATVDIRIILAPMTGFRDRVSLQDDQLATLGAAEMRLPSNGGFSARLMRHGFLTQ